MDIFFLSSVYLLLHNKYVSLCVETRIPKHEVADTEQQLANDLENMLQRRPYIPAIYCLFDYHGQVSML